MEPNPRSKISIIGCGNVGLKLAYASVIKGLAREIVMVDINKKKLEGEVMDLSHTAPFVPPVDLVAGSIADIVGSHVVVISAGKNQKPGQTRLDITRENVALFKQLVTDIESYAPSAIILVATNPVDILSYAAYKFSGRQPRSVIGSGTVLDSARFRQLLARHCNVDPRNVHAYIIGEHGDSEVPLWSKAQIGGVPIDEYCAYCDGKQECEQQSFKNRIANEVKDAAYQIISKKGETSSGISLALTQIIKAILNDENAIMPVSCHVDGYMGISGVYMSLPAIVNKHGVRNILKISLTAAEKDAFINSSQLLKSILLDLGI